MVHDAKTPGLCLHVTEQDVRTFYLYKKIEGRPQRIRIGRFGEISIEQARRAAGKFSGDIATGINPQQAKMAKRAEMTLGELWGWFLEHHAKPRKRSWKTDEGRWDNDLKHWAGKRLADISYGDVQALHNKIGGTDHHAHANRVLALLSTMLNKAKLIGYDGPNPTKDVERFQEASRERFLGPDELPKLLSALDAPETSEMWRDFYKLALLTGARRGNLLAMRWEDIHLDRGEWKIPDKSSKSGFSMTIPLVPEALAILNKRKNNGSEWVFPGPGKTGHVQEPRRTWEAILKRAGLTDVRIHDLRRTVGSWMAAGGASLPTIGKMLGHRNASTTQIYARLDLTSVKTAVTSATAAMMSTAPTAPKQAKKSKVMTYLAHPEK